jgi:tetratricopeptide (TPR) repeat protein
VSDLAWQFQGRGHLPDRPLFGLGLPNRVQRCELPPDQRAIAHYFLGNAWSNLRSLIRRDYRDWKQPELEREIFHYRMALRGEGICSLPDQRVCQILTNLGNAMSQVGRPAEAVEYWDCALKRLPTLAMTRGSKGNDLSYYATSVYDDGHKHLILKFAHADLEEALSPEMREFIEGNSHKAFDRVKVEIEGYLAPCCLDEARSSPLGGSPRERP